MSRTGVIALDVLDTGRQATGRNVTVWHCGRGQPLPFLCRKCRWGDHSQINLRQTPRQNLPGEPCGGARRPARGCRRKAAPPRGELRGRPGEEKGDRPGRGQASRHILRRHSGPEPRPGPRDMWSKARGFLSPLLSPGGKCPVVIQYFKMTLQVLRRAAERPSDICPTFKPVHLMTPWALGPVAARPWRASLPATPLSCDAVL